VGLAVAALACSSGPQNVGSKFVKTASVGPAGATISISASDDSAIAGTSITIPPNALAEATNISIGVSIIKVANYAPGSTGLGQAIDFEPSGTVFSVPVSLTIPINIPAGVPSSRVFVEAVEADGTARQIHGTYANGLATVQVSGFTSFGGIQLPSAIASCNSNADCPAGEVCVNAVCSGQNGLDAGPAPDSGQDASLSCSSNSDCAAGQTCVNGVCQTGLDAGPSDACVPTTCAASGATCGSLPDGCGGSLSCGTCSAGETCSNNVCTSSADASLSCSSNADCAAGQTCINGVCTGQALDAGPAPDSGQDATGCSSNSDCAAGETCVNGVCTSGADAAVCAAGTIDCNGVCANVSSDPQNCGACAHACAAGHTCTNGACN
jgi:stigma-specific protein Stig1